MATASPEEKVKHLTEKEATVLYWTCKGLQYGEIGIKLSLGEQMIQKYMSRVYEKLEFDLSSHWTRRRTILDETYCPLISVLYQEGEKWRPDTGEPRPSNQALMVVIQDEIQLFGENNAEIINIEPKTVEIIDDKKKPPIIPFLLLVVLLVTVIGAFAYLLGRITAPAPVAIIITQVVTAASQSPIQSTEVPLVVAPPIASSPSLQPTYTPYPTYTPVPAPTQIPPTPLPAISLPFSDNFDQGINPAWKSIVGTWMTNNGRLVPVNNGGWNWISLDVPEWKDYKVKVNEYVPNPYSAAQGEVAVAVRVSSHNPKMVAFLQDSVGLNPSWVLTDGDSHTLIAGKGNMEFINPVEIEIQVKGNEFIAFVNGREAQRMTYPGFESGGISLGSECGNNCPSFDNVVIEPIN